MGNIGQILEDWKTEDSRYAPLRQHIAEGSFNGFDVDVSMAVGTGSVIIENKAHSRQYILTMKEIIQMADEAGLFSEG